VDLLDQVNAASAVQFAALPVLVKADIDRGMDWYVGVEGRDGSPFLMLTPSTVVNGPPDVLTVFGERLVRQLGIERLRSIDLPAAETRLAANETYIRASI